MFSGFYLSIENDFKDYVERGESIFADNKAQMKASLDKYFDVDGSINGTQLQSDWFPQVECDIFLSHSHKDEKLAKGLAGWLNRYFGLKVFIDSCVWGYSLELQKKIDDKYCGSKTSADPTLYDYQSVIYSTSHVNMMLSTALTMMLDKAESVFLLSTPNVITVKDTIDQTESPWIYHEISMTKMVRKKNLSEYRKKVVTEGTFQEQASVLKVKYDVDLSHLLPLTQSDLDSWQQEYQKFKSRNRFGDVLIRETMTTEEGLYPLDIVYKKKKILEGE